MTELHHFEPAPPRRERLFPFIERHIVIGRVSDDFKSILNDVLAKIPDLVIHSVKEYGYQLEIGSTLLALRPDLKNQKPRGYLSGKTFENVEGFHDPLLKRIYVFEYFKPNVLNQHLTKNTRGEAVFRHEIGHALDVASGGLSNSFWFIAAYELDFEKLIMDASMKDEMVRHFYYLQEGQAGRRETFAELFAILIGGGSDRKAVLKVAFPNSYNAVQEWIGRLK